MNIRYKVPLLPGWESSCGKSETDDLTALVEHSRTRMGELEQAIEEASRLLNDAQREYALTQRKVMVVAALVDEMNSMREAPTPAGMTAGQTHEQRVSVQRAAHEGQQEREGPSSAATPARAAGRWRWGFTAVGALLVAAGMAHWLASGTWAHAADVTIAVARGDLK